MLFDYKMYHDGLSPHFPLWFLQLRLSRFCEGHANGVKWEENQKLIIKMQLLTKLC